MFTSADTVEAIDAVPPVILTNKTMNRTDKKTTTNGIARFLALVDRILELNRIETLIQWKTNP